MPLVRPSPMIKIAEFGSEPNLPPTNYKHVREYTFKVLYPNGRKVVSFQQYPGNPSGVEGHEGFEIEYEDLVELVKELESNEQ